MKNVSMQIKFILGNASHKNNPLRIRGKIIQHRQGKSSEFKELYNEPFLKDSESVTMEVTDLGVTVNCFLVIPCFNGENKTNKMRGIQRWDTRYNTRAFFYNVTGQLHPVCILCVFWTLHLRSINKHVFVHFFRCIC